MAQPEPGQKHSLVISLPEALAKRLQLAATRSSRPPSAVVLDILDRSLPRLEDSTKKIPYT